MWTRNALAGLLSKMFAYATSSMTGGGRLKFADPELRILEHQANDLNEY